ncbi:MAG TPA: HAMP domain-containing sensor histidine kinase [Verrucomicrobiae bacterium]|nr:HAMP domain-containing sensor histidine kinase [Verrucomicrobiae bacterium]
MPIRLRLTLLFAAAAALLAVLGGLLLVHQLGTGLVSSLDDTLANRITSIAGRADFGGQPVDYGLAQAILGGQAAQGNLAELASPAAATTYDDFTPARALLSAGQLRVATRRTVTVDTVVAGTTEPLRVRAAPLPGESGWAIVVAASLQPTNAAVTGIRGAVVLGGLAVVVLAGLGAWLLAGAALAPMDRLRREADAISASDPAARLQVPRTRDEVAALARTMNALLQRLQGALARQRAFLADAGHELRTPLAILRTELELAGRPGRSHAELTHAVDSAADETQRVIRLAEHLLLLARSDEGRLVGPAEPGRLDDLLQAACDGVAQQAAARGVIITVDAARPLPVPMDSARVRQAVDNLLGNALRFAPAGSAIELHARLDGNVPGARVEVRDRGPGFPDDFLPRAFERFSRPGHARARDQGGSGLGLSIVRAIAEGHGGSADAANREGGGAVVGFTLPLRGPTGGAPGDAEAAITRAGQPVVAEEVAPPPRG